LKGHFGRLLFAILNKKVAISGQNNINTGKRYLIVANYPSGYAGFVMMMLFPEASILVHAFMSRVPILSNLLKRNGFIYACRGGYIETRNTIREMARRYQTGLIILPEGKPTPDGRIHEFKRGFIHILRNSPLDLLPITLNGFFTLKQFMRFYLDPDAELEVIIHIPMSQSVITGMNDEQLRKETTSMIECDYRP
jgi:1-acyl-sn-glycerol-3-phosphate acyltransferase